MKTQSLFSLSLLACLIGVGAVGARAANAESRTLYIPFRAVVSESCYTPASLSDIAVDNQSSCSVYRETVESIEGDDEAQPYVEYVDDSTDRSDTEVVQVTIVGR